MNVDELTPLQRMLLEVYRVHRAQGFPGRAAGTPKHDRSCRKCALLAAEPDAFEEVLPFASVAHLLPVGHSGRAR